MSPGLMDRLLARLRPTASRAAMPTEPVPAEAAPAAPSTIAVDLPGTLRRDFPAEFSIAEQVTAQVLASIGGVDMSALARRSPALLGYDWTAYLRCSMVRIVRVLRVLAKEVPAGGRVLDFRSYFGNFALAAKAAGFRVDALDAYGDYSPALSSCEALQRTVRIEVLIQPWQGSACTRRCHPRPTTRSC